MSPEEIKDSITKQVMEARNESELLLARNKLQLLLNNDLL